jgi:hypothetical protein
LNILSLYKIGDLLTDSDIVDIVKSIHTKMREREEEKEEINEEKKITHKEAIELDFIKSVKSVQTDLTNFVIKKD